MNDIELMARVYELKQHGYSYKCIAYAMNLEPRKLQRRMRKLITQGFKK